MSNNTFAASPMNRRPAIAAALGISTIGAIFYNLLPLFVGAAQDYLHLGDRQVGFLGAAFFAGFNLVTLSAFFWIRRFNWRRICLAAIPLAALALLAAPWLPGYGMLLALVAIAGGAFSAFYGVGTTALGDTREPARWYGFKIALEGLFGALLLYLIPALVLERWGLNGLMATMALLTLLFLPLVRWLPTQSCKDGADAADSGVARLGAAHGCSIAAGLLALLLFFTGASAAWAFVERIGNSGGHSGVAVGTVLACTLVFATLGSLLEAWMSDRFGYLRPFAGAVVCFLFALYLLLRADSLPLYACGACLVAFAFGLAVPVLISITAHLDSDGRFIVLTVPALGLGAMFGPGIAGMLTGGVSFVPVLWFAGTSAVIALLLSAVALFDTGRASVAAALSPAEMR